MKKQFLVLATVIMFSGCASLTPTQIAAVNQFARLNDNFSAYPGKIMTGLAKIRVNRGVYYANSLDNPKLHLQELDNIYSQQKIDFALSKKVDITFKVIDRYAQVLLLLSSDKYTGDVDKQEKNFGAGLDSLVTVYNSMKEVQQIPPGIGGAVSQLVEFGGKVYIRTKQARAIKKFVPVADTMIAVMTNNLLEFLASTNIQDLIRNEEVGINDNYLSFLRQIRTVSTTITNRDTVFSVLNTRPSIENEKDYLELKTGIEEVKILQVQTIAATKSLRRAHKRLLSIITKKANLKTAVTELQQFYEDVKEVKSTMEEIDKPKR